MPITASATLTSAGLTGAISLALMAKQARSRGRTELAAALQVHGYAADMLAVSGPDLLKQSLAQNTMLAKPLNPFNQKSGGNRRVDGIAK